MGRKKSNMSVKLARALASGRREPQVRTRADILAALLRKRSVAANAGLIELEAQIRSQILWALPIERPGGEGAEPERDRGGESEAAGLPGAPPCER